MAARRYGDEELSTVELWVYVPILLIGLILRGRAVLCVRAEDLKVTGQQDVR